MAFVPSGILFFARCMQQPAALLQQDLRPVSSEICDLLLFVSHFASQCKRTKFGGDYCLLCIV